MKKCLLISVISLFVISCQKSEDNPSGSPTPPNVPNVTIGTQIWSVNNLDVTTYRNGDPIPQATDPIQWKTLTTGAWCYFNNDPTNNASYGKLYNWHAVNDPRGLTPVGWHVPTNVEWTTLTDYLGGDNLATGTVGGKMKAISSLWISPNTGATNSSGFSGLPGGRRDNNGYEDIGYYGSWWSSIGFDLAGAWYRYLSNNNDYVGNSANNKTDGYSVRMIKN